MTNAARISDAEWEVMRVIWERSPITANEVVTKLSETSDWNHRTIRTMLNRLVKKGALSVEHRGKTYLYRAAVARSVCVRKETMSFVDRVLGGAVSPMLISFVKNTKLSPDEIAELRKALEDKEK